MLFAIVDIETTGGYAAANGITEIAVFVTDGVQVIEEFHSLVNPQCAIPSFVESLTGITNEMVTDAPPFEEIAIPLYRLLHDKIFVAHNVNFDYSFIRHHLQANGISLDCKKLCTIRLGRKILPGLPGYGLDKICRHLQINIEGRHRAKGDAAATVQLFHLLMRQDAGGHMQAMLKGNSKEHFLPPNLAASVVRALPMCPGVYYFHDKKGKVIYVGKARNLSRRVNGHFSNNKSNRQKQEFIKRIYDITYRETATELMAFILESTEIRKLWPEENRSQKRFEAVYGLYSFADSRGYVRLCIEKRKKLLNPLYTFNLLAEGNNLLRRLVKQFALCPKLCFLQHQGIPCDAHTRGECKGACHSGEDAAGYNERVHACIASLQTGLPTFAIVDAGRRIGERSCILMENGRFYGMGYLPQDATISELDQLKEQLTPYAENDYIRGLIYQFAERQPAKKIELNSQFIEQRHETFS